MLRNTGSLDPDPDSDFWLDSDPDSMNIDPKHWCYTVLWIGSGTFSWIQQKVKEQINEHLPVISNFRLVNSGLCVL